MVKHLKQFVGKLPTSCLSVFDNFVGLALKGLSMCDFFIARNEMINLNRPKLETHKNKSQFPSQHLPNQVGKALS